jgi:hypothetical protein
MFGGSKWQILDFEVSERDESEWMGNKRKRRAIGEVAIIAASVRKKTKQHVIHHMRVVSIVRQEVARTLSNCLYRYSQGENWK